LKLSHTLIGRDRNVGLTTYSITNHTKEIKLMESIKTLVYPVKDLAGAKTLFSTLFGVKPYADETYYIGFKVGEQDIGLDPTAKACPAPPPFGMSTTLKKPYNPS
jgi:hypothetical protein